MERAERAARMVSLQYVRRAVLDSGPAAARRVLDRLAKAERTIGRSASWRTKHYRKAARKAARLFR